MKRDEHIVYIVFVKTMFKKWIQVIMKKNENKKKTSRPRETTITDTLIYTSILLFNCSKNMSLFTLHRIIQKIKY